MTDLEKAYLLGYRDGYNRALPTRREINEIVNQVKKEIRAEIEAARAKTARLLEVNGAADFERDPTTRLN
jgi:L-fucose mutarotase/ribose pyranase (RbsD/FucU family)